MKNKNAILMTVKNHRELTDKCLKTMFETSKGITIDYLIIVDGSDIDQVIDRSSIFKTIDAGFYGNWIPRIELKTMKCSISEGWNEAITILIEQLTNESRGSLELEQRSGFRNDVNIWFLNNDVEFMRKGWLEALSDRLGVEGTGVVGSSAMSVFGHPFATGGIWGTTLKIALEIAENGKVLDERLNFAYQDVDLSVRIAKAGYVVTHVPDVELGDNPMMRHLVSRTVYANEGEPNVMSVRAKEAKIFIQKHGRRE